MSSAPSCYENKDLAIQYYFSSTNQSRLQAAHQMPVSSMKNYFSIIDNIPFPETSVDEVVSTWSYPEWSLVSHECSSFGVNLL